MTKNDSELARRESIDPFYMGICADPIKETVVLLSFNRDEAKCRSDCNGRMESEKLFGDYRVLNLMQDNFPEVIYEFLTSRGIVPSEATSVMRQIGSELKKILKVQDSRAALDTTAKGNKGEVNEN